MIQGQEFLFSETVRGIDEIIVYNSTNAYIIPLSLNVTLEGEYSSYLGVFNVTEVNFYSDGDVQNNIAISYIALNDACLNSSDLIERDCNQQSSDKAIIYACLEGCLDGACSETLPTLSFWAKFIQWIKDFF